MKILMQLLAWLAVVAILVLGFAWLAGWFHERTAPGEVSAPAAAKPQEPLVEVVSEATDTYLPVPGRLWAAKRTRVTAEIIGKITDIAVVAGDQVEVGAELVRLDQTELAARVGRIQEQLPARRARLKEAQAEFDRYRELVQDGAVSREAFETTRRLLYDADAALAGTEQELEMAKGQLAETVIKATIRGTIVDQLAKAGEVARPGYPLLEIYQPETLRLECSVPESLAGKLSVGQSLRAELGSTDEGHEVTIDEIVPQSDSRSRTVLIKSSLKDAGARFEGQYGRLFVPLARGKKLTIPRSALQTLGQLDFVEVLTDQDTMERRFVKRGVMIPPDRIEILSGLDAGEQVVLPSRRKLSDDTPD